MMTGTESDNFYVQDERKYILNKNNIILEFMEQKKKENIFFILDIEQMQKMMSDIVLFFEFKYPDNFLCNLLYERKYEKKQRGECQKIAKTLNIEQLKYRLYHDYVQFLDCSYASQIHITREKKHLWECSFASIRIDDKGYIEPYDLEHLKENKFLENIEGVKKASDLLGRFIESTIEVDYSELTNVVLTHKANIKLKNMVLKLIPLYMIYSKNTLPEYGYIRAKSFIRMFNKEYNLNMDTEEIDEIMSRDYSNIEKPKMKIIQNIRK